ncbi:MAG: hypothetical protein ABEJ65_00845 [bacterium]
MTAVEWIASIMVGVVVIKLTFFTFNEELWLAFAESIYDHPIIMQIVCLAGALVCLYVLIPSLSIVEIWAVLAFLSLVMGIGLAPYGKSFIGMARELLDEKGFWKANGVSVLVWIGLIVWGIYELSV